MDLFSERRKIKWRMMWNEWGCVQVRSRWWENNKEEGVVWLSLLPAYKKVHTTAVMWFHVTIYLFNLISSHFISSHPSCDMSAGVPITCSPPTNMQCPCCTKRMRLRMGSTQSPQNVAELEEVRITMPIKRVVEEWWVWWGGGWLRVVCDKWTCEHLG